MGIIPQIEWPQLTDSQTWAMLLACVMMLGDVLSGFVGACVRHDVQSTKMREGIGHKVLLMIIIAIAYILGVGLQHVSGANITVPSTEVVCAYIVVMELASITENVNKAWPEFSGTALSHLLKGGDEDEHE